jgi:hypothetical protein
MLGDGLAEGLLTYRWQFHLMARRVDKGLALACVQAYHSG